MQITFTIDLEGNITSDVEGGDGVNCLEATDPYEKALGEVYPDREMKPEASELNFTGVQTTNQIHL